MTMLRSLFVAFAAAAGLLAFAALGDVPGGSAMRATISVALGVAVTSIIYGEATFSAVAVGAASPLALAATDRASVAWGAAAMCALWLTPRLTLAETRRKLSAGAALSIAAACVAGFIFASYVEAPLATHVAACIFAGSCLSLVGILVPLATPTAFALSASASVIEEPFAETLKRAAATHETSRWQQRTGEAREKWRALVRLADRRAALERLEGATADNARRDLEARIATMLGEIGQASDAPSSHVAAASPPSASSPPSATPAPSATPPPSAASLPGAEITPPDAAIDVTEIAAADEATPTAPDTNSDETPSPSRVATTEI
jgi:hypothetical protein